MAKSARRSARRIFCHNPKYIRNQKLITFGYGKKLSGHSFMFKNGVTLYS